MPVHKNGKEMPKNGGFSLIEVIISAMILGIIAVSIGQFTVRTRSATRLAEVRLQTAFASNILTQKHALPRSSAGTVTDSYTSPDGTLTFDFTIEFVHTTDSVSRQRGGAHNFSYLLATSTTRCNEHPAVSSSVQTIVRKLP